MRRGRPIVIRGSEPTPEGNHVCPGAWGGTNWMSPSFSPQTDLFYVAAREQCDVFTSSEQPYREGGGFFGSSANPPPKQKEKDWGSVRAIDSGDRRDQVGVQALLGAVCRRHVHGGRPGVRGRHGRLPDRARRADRRHLWHFQTGAPIYSAAITYALDGRQYLAIPSGGALTVFALPEDRRPTSRRKPVG